MGRGEISLCGRTNCARTDISPLACTTNNASEVSALQDIPILFALRGMSSAAPCEWPQPYGRIDRGRGQPYVQGEVTPLVPSGARREAVPKGRPLLFPPAPA